MHDFFRADETRFAITLMCASSLGVFGILQTFAQSGYRERILKDSEEFRASFYEQHQKRIDKIELDVIEYLDKFADRAISSVVENSGSFSVIPLGSPTDAFHYLNIQLESAISVKNTVIGLGASQGYDEKLHEVYRRFFSKSKDGIWEDIVSHSEIYGERFKLKDVSSEWTERHRVFILDRYIPIINFTIVKYKIGPKGTGSRLFVGWTNALNQGEQSVFVTHEEQIIRVFEAYFDYLKQQESHDRKGTSIDFSAREDERIEDLKIVKKSGDLAYLRLLL